MSIALLPPSRSNENLVYLVIPLAISLVITALANPDLELTNGWLSLTLIVGSISSLFFYVFRPVEFAGRIYLRKVAWNKKGAELQQLLTDWNSKNYWSTPQDYDMRLWARSMIGYAVSSTTMKERHNKIRMLIHFAFAFVPILIVIAVYACKVVTLSWAYGYIWIGLVIFSIVGYVILYYIGTRSRFYGSQLYGDIKNLASFYYIMLHTKKGQLNPPVDENGVIQQHPNIDNLAKEIAFLDGVLVRGDIGLFVRLWQDISTAG